MTTFTIISEELMQQKVMNGIFTNKSFNTVAEEVVGKWCVMVQSSTGLVGVGINEDKNIALELAKAEAC